jgi:hypothetical protein
MLNGLERWFNLRESFYQTGEVDQELEYEMHQTEYKVMIGCVMDWPP